MPANEDPEYWTIYRWLEGVPAQSLFMIPAFSMQKWENGAHNENRTHDLILTKDVLYRLSYMGLQAGCIM